MEDQLLAKHLVVVVHKKFENLLLRDGVNTGFGSFETTFSNLCVLSNPCVRITDMCSYVCEIRLHRNPKMDQNGSKQKTSKERGKYSNPKSTNIHQPQSKCSRTGTDWPPCWYRSGTFEVKSAEASCEGPAHLRLRKNFSRKGTKSTIEMARTSVPTKSQQKQSFPG